MLLVPGMLATPCCAWAQSLRLPAGQQISRAELQARVGATVVAGRSADDAVARLAAGALQARRVGRTTLTLVTDQGAQAGVPLTVTPGDLDGTVGAIYLFPSGLAGGIEPNTHTDFDLGNKAWWMSDWPGFAAARDRDLAALQQLYDRHPRTLLIIYFPLYLADASYGGTYLDELQAVLQWFNDHGIETMLFFGRPDYHYAGADSQAYADPTTDMTQQDYVVAALDATLGHGSVASLVHLVSVYYMGLAANAGRTTANVLAYNQRLKATINSHGPDRAVCPGDNACLRYIQHVDGPFWEAGYADPSNWNENGYTPADISPANGASDGLMAESWVQGSLPVGLAYLFDNGYFGREQVMVINDIPNCDDAAVAALPGGRCATGDGASAAAVDSDNAMWFGWLRDAGVRAWSRWDYADAGSGDVNAYGAVDAAGVTMTENARQQQRHAGIFLDGFDR
ncbi:MAG TPA: hypothetical protein VFG73_06670 [Rhodanobacteraceae bacterium]|nr:hypothetical protein [Rhodanobacteraceae bacterium]